MSNKNNKKVTFITSFDIDRLTGTPIRANITARALTSVYDKEHLQVITAGSNREEDIVIRQSENFFSAPSFIWRGYLHIQKFNPHTIHAVTALAAIPALLYKLLHRVDVVFEHHGLLFYELKDQGIVKRYCFGLLDMIALYFSDTLICMSFSQKEYLVKNYDLAPEKIEVIWGPVEMDMYPDTQQSQGATITVGYIGNDAWWQGLGTIKDAAKELQEEKVEFLLAGFDPDGHEEINGLSYIGRISREKVEDFYSRCDVLLSTRVGGSVSELQYPQKLSEYLAAGRPVIVTDVSDQRRVVEKANAGFVIPPEDAIALEDTIREMSSMDKRDLERMGENGRAFAEENLSMSHLSERLVDLYKS